MSMGDLSDYEQRAWADIGRQLAEKPAQHRYRAQARDAVARGASAAVTRSSAMAEHVPGSSRIRAAAGRLPSHQMEPTLRLAIGGLKSAMLDPAMHSVTEGSVRRRYAKHGYEMADLSEIQLLDLRDVDQVMPKLRGRYVAALGIEGAASGAAVSGVAALVAVGSISSGGVASAPGAGLVLGAIAADAATLVAGTARLVAHTAAFHGYPISTPEEELKALATLNISLAGAGPAKAMAFRELSLLTQRLARHATWQVLNESILVKVIARVYGQLGFRLTQRKLGQAVPLAGIGISAGLNAAFARTIADDSRLAYRARFLGEKAGLDLASLVETSDLDQTTSGLELIFDEEIAAADSQAAATDNDVHP